MGDEQVDGLVEDAWSHSPLLQRQPPLTTNATLLSLLDSAISGTPSPQTQRTNSEQSYSDEMADDI
jgi:hypothetical protein